LAGGLLFDEKIQQNAALFGWNVGILHSQALIKRKIYVSHIFGARFGGKDCGLSTCKP
jgi:hypothetical protein